MPYLAGYQAEKYDRRPKDVYPRIQERLNEYTRQKVRDTIHGYTTVNNIRFQNTYRGTNAVYTLLPVWLHRYRYKGKTYQFAMNGQTGKIVGKPPPVQSHPEAVLLYQVPVMGNGSKMSDGMHLLPPLCFTPFIIIIQRPKDCKPQCKTL